MIPGRQESAVERIHISELVKYQELTIFIITLLAKYLPVTHVHRETGEAHFYLICQRLDDIFFRITVLMWKTLGLPESSVRIYDIIFIT